jgi:hypothetical protein
VEVPETSKQQEVVIVDQEVSVSHLAHMIQSPLLRVISKKSVQQTLQQQVGNLKKDPKQG